MGATYLSLHYHIVFSTKERAPILNADLRPRLYEYVGGTIRGLEAGALGIGGTADHIHLLVWLRSTHQLSEFVRSTKRSSAKWIREELDLNGFAWQEGYGAFTVGPASQAAVCRYIANQEQHHRKMTFQEEFVRFLDKAGVKYEPRYLD